MNKIPYTFVLQLIHNDSNGDYLLAIALLFFSVFSWFGGIIIAIFVHSEIGFSFVLLGSCMIFLSLFLGKIAYDSNRRKKLALQKLSPEGEDIELSMLKNDNDLKGYF